MPIIEKNTDWKLNYRFGLMYFRKVITKLSPNQQSARHKMRLIIEQEAFGTLIKFMRHRDELTLDLTNNLGDAGDNVTNDERAK